MGAHRAGESLLYINPGTNFWGIPFRIGALPEVTVLTLRRVREVLRLVGVDPDALPSSVIDRSVTLLEEREDHTGMDKAYLAAARSLAGRAEARTSPLPLPSRYMQASFTLEKSSP